MKNKFCIKCGNKLPRNAVVCPYCQKKIKNKKSLASKTQSEKNRFDRYQAIDVTKGAETSSKVVHLTDSVAKNINVAGQANFQESPGGQEINLDNSVVKNITINNTVSNSSFLGEEQPYMEISTSLEMQSNTKLVSINGNRKIIKLLDRNIGKNKILHAEISEKINSFRKTNLSFLNNADGPFFFNDEYYVSYDFIIGKNLQERFIVQDFVVSDLCNVCNSMMALLNELDSYSLCHGNLKPTNIFLNNFGKYILTDLELTHNEKTLSKYYTQKQTHASIRQHSIQADLYAFFAIMDEFISGTHSLLPVDNTLDLSILLNLINNVLKKNEPCELSILTWKLREATKQIMQNYNNEEKSTLENYDEDEDFSFEGCTF